MTTPSTTQYTYGNSLAGVTLWPAGSGVSAGDFGVPAEGTIASLSSQRPEYASPPHTSNQFSVLLPAHPPEVAYIQDMSNASSLFGFVNAMSV